MWYPHIKLWLLQETCTDVLQSQAAAVHPSQLPALTAACFTPWNHPGICQTDPQAVLLNPSYPAQPPLGWAGFALAGLEDLKESLWSSDSWNHHFFFKAELDKRINLPRPGWNLGRAEHFLCRDGGELNIAWIRTVTARDHERQSRQGHCGTRKNCDGSYLLWSL